MPSQPVTNTADDQSFVPIGLSPRQVVSAYGSCQWEQFIEEWIHALKAEYAHAQHFAGAGDKGRDVAGFVGQPSSGCAWDNYQCKHYANPLRPTDAFLELGKLCFYTHRGDFTIPRRFRFVAPHEVGPKLKDLFLKPAELRTELIRNWPTYCETKITETQRVPLTGALLQYVEQFDFSIVGYVPLLEIIDQHMRTPYWTTRFQAVAPARPPPPEPPAVPDPSEAQYVRKLLDAYGDAEGRTIGSPEDLQSTLKYHNHLRRSRQWFFQAEGLNRFSRDTYPAGAFDRLKKQVFDGVVDVVDRDFAHGYDRVCATTDQAANLALANSPLAPISEVGDKKGICHHLANDGQLGWVRP